MARVPTPKKKLAKKTAKTAAKASANRKSTTTSTKKSAAKKSAAKETAAKKAAPKSGAKKTTKTAAQKSAPKTAAKKTTKPAAKKTTKTAAKTKKTAPKPAIKKTFGKSAEKPVAEDSFDKLAAIDTSSDDTTPVIDPGDELSVDKLLAHGRKLEADREALAAAERGKPRSVRDPAAVRPSNPIHWGYSYCLDVAVPEPQYGQLNDFFEAFTKLSDDRTSFYIVGPDTDPEARRAAWDRGGAVLEYQQILAQLPPDDLAARTRRLTRVLEQPSSEGWSELNMLLSTWDRETVQDAIAVADKLLSLWPDELRSMHDAWKDRPELRQLVRVHWGELGEHEASPDITVLHTQDTSALKLSQQSLGNLKTLDLSGKAGLPAVVTGLTALTGLEKLLLMQPTYKQGTAKSGLAKLLHAPHLQQLRGLSLYGYTLDTRDLQALADGPQPLEHLRLQYARLQPDAAHALAAVAARTRLRTLDLKYNDLGPEGAAILFADPRAWSSLRVLDFSANEIGDDGVAAIAGAELHDLHWLSVSSNDTKNQLTAAAGRSLAEASALANLAELHVFGHPIGPDGLAAIFNSPHLRSLRALNASFAGVSLAELAARSDADPVPLEVLNIGHLGASGKRLDMGGATFLRKVRNLNVESLGGDEYAAVLACPHLGALETLRLGGCYVDEAKGFDALVHCEPPPNLHYLDLSGWKFTPAKANKLAESPLGRQLWGLALITSYTPPDTWRAFYDAGLPLIGSPLFDANAPNEHATSTTFREEL